MAWRHQLAVELGRHPPSHTLHVVLIALVMMTIHKCACLAGSLFTCDGHHLGRGPCKWAGSGRGPAFCPRAPMQMGLLGQAGLGRQICAGLQSSA